ncbi:hypothetical protein ABB37_03436 [Leptomonas pyrrhocoris]|uniref:Uncharacterized protein n=1 Tax=Leptomonas pyrrhocoris TaxID=157538 RepID=A0A0M9G4Z1_LEPPY|nr:hypothetical protein ABB37_03436 [Leptomonas pyrrhocoris]KPA82347.1 hypothetical protein ABB37_03436 [Leptomonas pyrrhocoris]|eukprot:XP_015660786.1 hypothetical protein ABB37_03436 [Leptomonas pyrrhocoris]
MSRIAPVTCPLSDCTLAVDNAENIRNSNDKALLLHKVSVSAIAPSQRRNARSSPTQVSHVVASVDATEKTPSARRERVVGGTRKVNARTVATTLASVSLEEHRPSALDVHVFAKPFTPATPRRNDPYSPCLLNSPCTPEDTFYACYGDAEAVATEATPTASLMNTPVCTRTAGQKPSTLGETTRNLLEMLSLISTPNKSPCGAKPVRPTESQSPRPSSPERAASPSQQQPVPSSSTRVVRKVVCCNVDRTSGRPVPKPKAA